MKLNKKGFTLVEILITLGIIGVIAALTLPSLVNAIINRETGAALSRAVATIENGCTTMFNADRDLREDFNKDNVSEGEIAINPDVYALISSLNEQNTTDNHGLTFDIDTLGIYTGYRLENNGEYIFDSGIPMRFTATEPEETYINEDDKVVTLTFYRNNQEPAERQFTFDLLNNGKLRPRGFDSDAENYDCPNTPENCAARVVRDGYRINY